MYLKSGYIRSSASITKQMCEDWTYFTTLYAEFTTICLSVRILEQNGFQAHNDNGQNATSYASIESRMISWRVLVSKDQASCNPTDAAKANECRRAEGSLPLAADVIGLICHRRRNIRVRAGCGKENTEVAHTNTLGKAHKCEADNCHDHVENDNRTTDVVFVAEPARGIHNDAAEDVGRSNKALCSADIEAHAIFKNDWQKVGESISDRSGVEKDQCVTPNFDVKATSEEAAKCEGLRLGIGTVGIDAVDDEVGLFSCKEVPVGLAVIRKANEEDIASDTKSNR